MEKNIIALTISIETFLDASGAVIGSSFSSMTMVDVIAFIPKVKMMAAQIAPTIAMMVGKSIILFPFLPFISLVQL